LIAIFYLLLNALLFWLNLPEVYQNAVTEDCIAVVTKEGVVPCSGEFPSRYVRIPIDPNTTYEDVAASLR